ncbi:hypothetical protein [Phytomonospora endophytica]|uniref:LemA family protein n=1 Tax=Phytomonospora endophytica TaxID=714109 RepID=A0A841F8Y7_9ACTN|nr:hypothetical protein [Phytomonospora endophytica]MBB6032706.1 hypothetical protein [Phytomonospora endophytica]GIG66145.1 hypothetical protein Pen01_24400 [Phytomonospora endophytica]
MWWVVGVVALIVLASTYLTWTATRVERLHRRSAAARDALDGKLDARALAAAALAAKARPALGRYADALDAAARAALESVDGQREATHNDLTRVLRELPLEPDDPELAAIARANRRLSIARQLHSDVVRDARSSRWRPLVRVFGLARRHPEPRYFDIDDPA